MKKLLLMLIFGLLLTGCTCCKKEQPQVAKIVVENVISTDREQMYDEKEICVFKRNAAF
jgi:hypothetical protein